MSALPAALSRVRPAVEHRLTQVLEDCHLRWEDLGQAAPELLEAAGSVLSGGKRMRAVLGAVGCAILSTPEQRAECLTGSDAVHLGTALELYQASALVHDDLMDHADVRRGRPTVHKRWNENTAVLSGDTMLLLAYRLIAQCTVGRREEVLHLFTDSAIRICEGQQYDVNFESQ